MESVLLDIGTGYFVEVSRGWAPAQGLCCVELCGEGGLFFLPSCLEAALRWLHACVPGRPAEPPAAEPPPPPSPRPQRDLPGGIDYCRRKVLLVQEKMAEIGGVVKQRQAMLEQVSGVLEQKVEQQQQQQKGGQ